MSLMSLKSDEPVEPHHLLQRNEEVPCPIRPEKIRLIVLGLAFLALLTGFCLDLLDRSVLSLFVVMVVAFLGYTRLDAWLEVKDV